MKLLKYCNIKNIFETRTVGLLKIPFLGFHLISENDFLRYKNIKECVKELHSYYPNSKAVLVTKEKDIKKLSSIIKDIEFDGVQLHYMDSDLQASALKGEFGKEFIVIQVVTSELSDFLPAEADYVLLDKSYLGGTGQQIDITKITEVIDKLKGNKIFLAGGISPSNIYQYLNLDVEGFDIQSALKSENATVEENTDYLKMINLAKLLGYEIQSSFGQVGFVIQDINQENEELLQKAIDAKVDFFHIDVSDGFVGIPTNISETKALIEKVKNVNSHLKIQIHFFLKSEKEYKEISNKLGVSLYSNCEVFLHINRDNFDQYSHNFIENENVFFAVDIKDVINETFPWEQFVKKQMIVCMQSKEHLDRIDNLNRGLKLIRYSTTMKPIISIDRSVDYEVILGLEDKNSINVVCGSYLRENITDRYKLLKQYLYDEN